MCSNENTHYTIFNINAKNHPKLSQICSNEIFSKGRKNEFETAVVNESSVFEPLKFYCISTYFVNLPNATGAVYHRFGDFHLLYFKSKSS